MRTVAAAILLCCTSLSAQAMSIKWNLDGVTFRDGTSAIGSYFYDADTNAFSSINITTNFLGSTTYGVQTAASSATLFDTVVSVPVAGIPRLIFSLIAPMTNAGGTIGIDLTAFHTEGRCTNNLCTDVSPWRSITGGSVMAAAAAALPEPGTLSLLTIGVFGIAWVRRRKTA